MTGHRTHAIWLLGLSLLITAGTAVATSDTGHAWLMRVSQAARSLDYEGVFVYQHGTQLEAMRIFHRVEDGKARERLFSLNGAPREIVRNEEVVLCFLADENSVVVEHRKVDARNFPAILPERAQQLDANYIVKLERTGRIAGREVQRIAIKPRDSYRYGYDLWADTETGLLLKADLVDSAGTVIEQFMFTSITIGADIPPSALEPQTPGADLAWQRDSGTSPQPDSVSKWRAARLPPGFALTRRVARTAPRRKMPVEHLVYSDGLAAVSVFIERRGESASPAMKGEGRMGAVHAYGTQVGEYQVTAVGEVPAVTVAMIASSVALDQ